MATQLDFGPAILDPQKHRQNLLRKSRKCLRCSTSFDSHGPGNRVCGRCKSIDAWTSAVPEYSLPSAF
jgi:ribosomal protein S27AE